MIQAHSKRVVDGENTTMRASMNGLLRAIRYVGATEGNRYSAECMKVHSECAFYNANLGGTADFSVCPIFWDGLLFFKEEQL